MRCSYGPRSLPSLNSATADEEHFHFALALRLHFPRGVKVNIGRMGMRISGYAPSVAGVADPRGRRYLVVADDRAIVGTAALVPVVYLLLRMVPSQQTACKKNEAPAFARAPEGSY